MKRNPKMDWRFGSLSKARKAELEQWCLDAVKHGGVAPPHRSLHSNQRRVAYLQENRRAYAEKKSHPIPSKRQVAEARILWDLSS